MQSVKKVQKLRYDHYFLPVSLKILLMAAERLGLREFCGEWTHRTLPIISHAAWVNYLAPLCSSRSPANNVDPHTVMCGEGTRNPPQWAYLENSQPGGRQAMGHRESDMTEQTTQTHTHTHSNGKTHDTPGSGDLPSCHTLATDSLCGCGQVTSLPWGLIFLHLWKEHSTPEACIASLCSKCFPWLIHVH